MSNIIELEASFILDRNEDLIFSKISEKNFLLKEETIEEDTYYTDKEMTYIRDRICLRTRNTDNERLELTYKPKTDNKTEKYGKREVNIQINVEDYEDIKYVIEELGFIEYVSFKKHRKTYSKIIDNTEYNIMVDEIENVGKFIELEILTDTVEKQLKLKTRLDEFVTEIGCDSLDEKKQPYRDIVKQKQEEKA